MFSDSIRNSTTLLKLLKQNSIGLNIWTIVPPEIRNGKSSKESKNKYQNKVHVLLVLEPTECSLSTRQRA